MVQDVLIVGIVIVLLYTVIKVNHTHRMLKGLIEFLADASNDTR